MSLRLEKNWGTWAREYRPIYGPLEAGLGRFVDFRKNDFIGRDAAMAEKEKGGRLRLITFTVDTKDVDVIGDEPIYHDGKVLGWVTSGGYAHHAQKSVAMGYVPKEIGGERGWLRDRNHRQAVSGAAAARAAVRSQGREDEGVRFFWPCRE